MRNLLQPWIDVLVGLLQYLDEVTSLTSIVWGEERVRCTDSIGTTRTANAVHVVLRVVGIVEVDDKLHVVHICMFLASTTGETHHATKDTEHTHTDSQRWTAEQKTMSVLLNDRNLLLRVLLANRRLIHWPARALLEWQSCRSVDSDTYSSLYMAVR